MPFQPRNKCACRKDKLTQKEVRRRKRIRSRKWRKTHPYDPKKRREDYIKHKLKMISEEVASGKLR